MRSQSLKSGFTLIETLMYVGIFAVFFITVVQFSLNIQDNNLIATYRKVVATNSVYVANHLQDSFKNSTSVNTTTSVFDVTNGRLRIENGSNFYDYSLSNSILFVNINGTSYQLLYDDVQVTGFLVEKVVDSTSQIIGVRLSITYASAKKFSVNLSTVTMYYLK